jgi:hypothetical protein
MTPKQREERRRAVSVAAWQGLGGGFVLGLLCLVYPPNLVAAAAIMAAVTVFLGNVRAG